MKKQIQICLLAILLIFSGATTTFASFKVKSKEMTTISTTNNVTNTVIGHHKTFSERKLPKMLQAVKALVLPDKGKGKTGWPGIVSLVCGVVGLVSAIAWVPLGIAAIVFGIIGLNQKKHVYTGMALAGLILGAIEILLFILLVAIFAAFVL